MRYFRRTGQQRTLVPGDLTIPFGAPLIADEARPQREDKPQAFDERQPNKHDQSRGGRYGDLPTELVAGHAAENHQQKYRDIDTQVIESQAAQRDRSDHDAGNLPVEAL